MFGVRCKAWNNILAEMRRARYERLIAHGGFKTKRNVKCGAP